jgi:uncharacterized protein with HEPN domain
MRDDLARVVDIWLACRDILDFVSGVSETQFLKDGMLQKALCMSLEIIGEAARTISSGFKELHPDIPWADMTGLRNKIVHEYFRLDLDMIWQTVTRDIPPLLDLLKPLIPPEEPP